MLKKYDQEGVCPKCGHGAIDVWFCAGGRPGKRCWDDFTDTQEHLHRQCRGCHYEWQEACLDANDDTTLSKGLRESAG